MARDYELEVLRVAQNGTVTVVELLLQGDQDTSFGGAETGTTWRLDGTVLAVNPELRLASLTATTLQGTFNLTGALYFRAEGADFVIPRNEIDPAAVSRITDIELEDPIQTNFLGTNGTLTGARVLQARGLLVRNAGEGIEPGIETGTFVLLDDDEVIELGLPREENGQPPVLLAGNTANVLEVDQSIEAIQQMQLVQVEATLVGGGTATFEALRNDRGPLLTTLVPEKGAPDPALIDQIVSITALPNTLDGKRWLDFGFRPALNRVSLDTSDDSHTGTFGNDRILGRGGKDTLFGAHGDDRVEGAAGNDRLFGGLNDDTVKGGGGSDRLFGGAGKDLLDGGSGKDTLSDGAGRDVLIGGAGADVFVLRADRSRDLVTDFEDGLDRLDLGVAFDQLTITTLSRGRVSILHQGDTLIVTDSAGNLTAADFTAADFV